VHHGPWSVGDALQRHPFPTEVHERGALKHLLEGSSDRRAEDTVCTFQFGQVMIGSVPRGLRPGRPQPRSSINRADRSSRSLTEASGTRACNAGLKCVSYLPGWIMVSGPFVVEQTKLTPIAEFSVVIWLPDYSPKSRTFTIAPFRSMRSRAKSSAVRSSER
jgi:hypothetical protein